MNGIVATWATWLLAAAMFGVIVGKFMYGGKRKEAEDVSESPPSVGPKPGYQTSEFWLTVLSMGLTSGVAFVVAFQSDLSQLGGQIMTGTVSSAAILGFAVKAVTWINARTSLKSPEPSKETT